MGGGGGIDSDITPIGHLLRSFHKVTIIKMFFEFFEETLNF